MINAVGNSGINPIQMFSAMNAFKTVQAEPQQIIQDLSDGIEVNDNNLLKNQNLEEIKQFAKIAGESNISEDDIRYGITYGRSVIADYIA